ncbi:hypothetical protein LZ31DRAFT_611534 [Colletotrichum somersetense]|nr:hypothetical protein LZ31DRAFT_611534 [Colletotrichum somersetense]
MISSFATPLGPGDARPANPKFLGRKLPTGMGLPGFSSPSMIQPFLMETQAVDVVAVSQIFYVVLVWTSQPRSSPSSPVAKDESDFVLSPSRRSYSRHVKKNDNNSVPVVFYTRNQGIKTTARVQACPFPILGRLLCCGHDLIPPKRGSWCVCACVCVCVCVCARARAWSTSPCACAAIGRRKKPPPMQNVKLASHAQFVSMSFIQPKRQGCRRASVGAPRLPFRLRTQSVSNSYSRHTR